MSNTNTPFGFKWLGVNRGGGPATFSLVPRKVAAANTTPIYRGDVVQSLSTGYVAIGAAGITASQCAGIFWGVEYLSTSQGRNVFSNYWPSGDHAYDGNALILPLIGTSPNLFMVQATLTNFAFADIGQNCDISVGTGTVTSGYGVSGMTLDKSTAGTTATLPFRVIDLYSSIAPAGTNGTDDANNYNIVIVQSNPAQETGI